LQSDETDRFRSAITFKTDRPRPIGAMAKTDAQDYCVKMSTFGLKAFRNSRKSVEVGQRYRSRHSNFLGRTGDVWVVEDLFTASDAMPYAKLAAEADPSLSKTLSVAALIDRRRFLPA
jgi:hypothetical protein